HGKLVATEARRCIDVPATRAQNIRQPAKRLAAYQMSVAIVDLLQSVQVKEQQSKLSVRTLTALDFRIEHIYEVTIVGQTGQRITGRLSPKVIFQLPLPGDVFGDDLIGF